MKEGIRLNTALIGIYPYSSHGLAPAMLKAYCDYGKISLKSSPQILGFTVNTSKTEIIQSIFNEKFNVLGFACYVWNFSLICDIILDIKRQHPEIIIILGGPEVSSQPKMLLQNNSGVDFIIIGEGELTFAELLYHIEKEDTSYENILGLAFRNNENVVITSPRPLIEDLGELPSPFLTGIIDVNNIGSYLFAYETYRGCPCGCNFCSWGKNQIIRYFPIDRILKELALILSSCIIRRIYFSDSICNLNKSRFKQILKFVLSENKNNIIIDFELIPDLLDDETISLLIKLPDGYVAFGVQSINPITLKNMNRTWNQRQFEEKYTLLRNCANNLKIYVDLIYGLPGDNYQDYLKGIKYLMNLKPNKIQPHPLQILPGSKFWNQPTKYKLHFNQDPPHFLIDSNTFHKKDMYQAAKWTNLLYVYFNPAINSLLFLLSIKATEQTFRYFTRLLRWIRRIIPIEQIAKEIDVSPYDAKKLYKVLVRFIDLIGKEQELSSKETTVYKEIVKYFTWISTFSSSFNPANISEKQISENETFILSPQVKIFKFTHDITIILPQMYTALLEVSQLPQVETTLIFNYKINQVQKISTEVEKLLLLCDGEFCLEKVISNWIYKKQFTNKVMVRERLLALFNALYSQQVIEAYLQCE